jgi:aspartyl-tRNA(Asn)/glutamyl-tRNA(Gln) amidotransferase subunit B
MVDKGEINRKVARTVFEAVFTEDVDPEQYVEENSLKSVNDEGALRAVIEEIVAKNPQSVEDYRAGKKKAMGFFVGQTMRAMQGKADPAMVNQILAEILEK